MDWLTNEKLQTLNVGEQNQLPIPTVKIIYIELYLLFMHYVTDKIYKCHVILPVHHSKTEGNHFHHLSNYPEGVQLTGCKLHTEYSVWIMISSSKQESNFWVTKSTLSIKLKNNVFLLL